jgi:hypothetical protein
MIKQICLDYDGVLNDMLDPYIIWLKERGIVTNIKEWDCYSYPRKHWPKWATDFWKFEEYYCKCKPLKGAETFMAELKGAYPNIPIRIVTSTPEEITEYKNEHIIKYFGDFIDEIVNVDNACHKYQHTKDSVFVDDYFIPLLGHSMVNHNPSILFNLDERHPWVKIDTLNEVLDHQKKYCITYDSVLEAVNGFMQSC